MSNTKLYKCKLCDKEFSTGPGLGGHVFFAHTKKGEEAALRGSKNGNKIKKEKGITSKGYKHTKKAKEILSKIRVEALNENAFYSKRTVYKGITLDSSYELAVAESLDKNNIRWVRPKSMIWMDGDQQRRYIPDFYLPDFKVYLDPKNDFLIKKDKRKIQLSEKFNDVRIIVLNKNELSWDEIIKKI